MAKQQFALLFVAVFLFGCTSSPATPPKYITLCDNYTAWPNGSLIDTPGNYALANNITDMENRGNDCIRIVTDNVSLDCRGHALKGLSFVDEYGERSGFGNGIFLDNVNNVSVANCTITEFGKGIFLNHSNTNTLTNNNASQNQFGIIMTSSNNNKLINNTFEMNTHGVWGYNVSYNIFEYNKVNQNLLNGFEIHNSTNNNLTNNTANSNWNGASSSCGISLNYNSNNNTLVCNEASNNTIGFCLTESSGNTLVSNVANLDYEGILIEKSTDNIFSNNIIAGKGVLDFYCRDIPTQNIDNGNTCKNSNCPWITSCESSP